MIHFQNKSEKIQSRFTFEANNGAARLKGKVNFDNTGTYFKLESCDNQDEQCYLWIQVAYKSRIMDNGYLLFISNYALLNLFELF